jgi:hypothetical protein
VSHRGPIQQFSEICLACGQNIWDTDSCMKEYQEQPVGGYVNDAGYLEMCLRMAITGTAGPSNEQWCEGLKKLLAHLQRHPLPTR